MFFNKGNAKKPTLRLALYKTDVAFEKAPLFSGELFGELRLFAVRRVFMDNALSGSLVDGAHGLHERLFGGGLIAVCDYGVKALDGRFNLRRDHTIAKIFFCGNTHAL
jgi:hypothetical protein